MRGLHAIDAEIHELAARQHGLIARSQLLAAGLGEDAIDHRLAGGRLVRIERGVYALGHAQLRREAAWLAAVLAARPGAVVSHRSAAGLWGIRPPSVAFVEITVLGHGGVLRRGSRRVHRTRALAADEVTVERGVPTTTVARTLLADFQAHGDAHTRSDLEALLLQSCLDAGLPRPEVNRHDGTRESDLRWPRHRLVVEVDSWTFHGRTRRAFDHDRARDRALLRDGWRVARLTDRQIRDDPAGVAAEIRSLLATDGG